MAILEVGEKWEDMTFSESAGQGLTGTRTFQATTDDGSSGSVTTAAQILADSRIPAILTGFPGYPDCLLTERTATTPNAASREDWKVTLSYKSEMTKDEKEKNKPPLERAASIIWTCQKIRKPMRRGLSTDTYYQAWTGNETFKMFAPTNSAKDPIDPPLEYSHVEWIANITKNVDRIPAWFRDYEDAVNNADVTLDFYGTPFVVPKGCGQLTNIAMPKSKTELGTEYVQLSFAITVRTPREPTSAESSVPEPWDEEILDTGMRTYDATTKLWKNVEDANGISINLPIPFNGDGKPISPSGQKIEESDLYWSAWRPFPRKDFSVLPLT